MKKTINSKMLMFSILLLSGLFVVLNFTGVSAANDSIEIHSNIYNAASTINAEFKYEITPDPKNPTGASNEPTEIVVNFDNIAPSGNLTTKTTQVDFANTAYANTGLYKYIIKEVSSSNPDYSVSSESYEIYVVASNTEKHVYQQAKNINDDTKGSINFNHEPIYSYITINLKVEGDSVDKQEYFRFKVDIDSLCVGCKYDIVGQDEYANYSGQTIKTSNYYTVNGPVATTTPVQAPPNYIYMKHGQTVTIGLTADGKSQIPLGTIVKVMGREINLRKWTMYIDGIETQDLQHYVGRNIDFDILLVRDMLVPNTGIFMEALPFIVSISLGMGGLVVFLKLKAKNVK